MNKLAILIINYETPELVKNLHQTINKNFKFDNYDLTIIDNSKEKKYEEANIYNSENLGFDQVVIKWLLEKRKNNYAGYWLINSDIILEKKDYTEKILSFLKDTTIGLLSTRINENAALKKYNLPLKPQNLILDYNAKIEYMDFQCTVISNKLAQLFINDSNTNYFFAGLDIDFNLLCENKKLKKILIKDLIVKHLGNTSPSDDEAFKKYKKKKNLDKNLQNFELISKCIQARYGIKNIINKKQSWFGTKPVFYEIPEKQTKIIKMKNNKLKIHIYGLPHTLTIRDNPQMMTCAYTTKIWLLCKKLMEEGHEVIHYGVEIPKNIEGTPVPCTKHIGYIPYNLWYNTHGKRDANKTFHQHTVDLPTYQLAKKVLPDLINSNVKDPKKEVILASFGYWGKELKKITAAALIEFGIGYDATFTGYRAFESYPWMHTVYGIQDSHLKSPGWFDAVIPGYVDPIEFEFKEKKEDYFVYLGRIIDTKGIYVIAQLSKKYGFKLKMAGNGNTDWIKDYPNIEYLGVIGIEEKKKLLSNAKATFTNSHYVEPFGNVHVESLISGTPVITTDWGTYTDSVPHGVVGYRTRTWEDLKYAIKNIDKIKPQVCRDWAMANFSLDAVYPKFNAYFEKCATHFTQGKGWYFEQKNKKNYITNYQKNYEKYIETNILMTVNNLHVKQALRALKSFAAYHSNYNIYIVNCSLSLKNKQKFMELAGFKKFITADKKFQSIDPVQTNHITFTKLLYLDQIPNHGNLLILDSDLLFIKNISDFLIFNNLEIIHASDDLGTFQEQNDFNIKQNNKNSYFSKTYTDYFPLYTKYKDKITLNSGVLALNLNLKRGVLFKNLLMETAKKLCPKIQNWPHDQGIFNHLLYSENFCTSKDLKIYDYKYNSSSTNRPELINEIKVIHYHLENILIEMLKGLEK